MHYHAELWLPEKPEMCDLHDVVEEAIAEYGDGDIWDFWTLGGRWVSAHAPDYDPTKDIRSLETCAQCGGTGMRMDPIGVAHRNNNPTYTCNGCGQYDEETKRYVAPSGRLPGQAVKWPTEWVAVDHIIVPRSSVSDDFTCCVLFADGAAYQDEIWDGFDLIDATFKTKYQRKVKAALADILNYRDVKDDGFLVTLDLHN